MICELHAKTNCPLCVGPVQPNPVTGQPPEGFAKPAENMVPITAESTEIKQPIITGSVPVIYVDREPTLKDPGAISIKEAADAYAQAKDAVASWAEKLEASRQGLEVTRIAHMNAVAAQIAAKKKLHDLLEAS